MSKKSLFTTVVAAVLCMGAMAQSKTTPAKALLSRMKQLQKMGYMYGHQDDPFYGVSWEWEKGRSDTKELVGDYPAVMGFDLGGIEMGDDRNLDSVPFKRIREEIIAHHQRGGIVTISWHPRNPLLSSTSWIEKDTLDYNAAYAFLTRIGQNQMARLMYYPKATVTQVLEGSSQHDKFMQWLGRVAKFLTTLNTPKGDPIPFIFRPWHENNGSWFWWGRDNCRDYEYKLLWNMTQDFLNERLPGAIVWSYSPNLHGSWTEQEWMERYPGDDRVDLIGEDAYQWGGENDFKKQLTADLQFITAFAQKHNKLIAITECGYKNSPDATWWTRVFKPIADGYPICYFLPWRNYSKEHFGAAPGLTTADNFLKLYNAQNTLFLNDIKNVK